MKNTQSFEPEMYLEHGPSWATLAAWRWGEGGGHLQNISTSSHSDTPLNKYIKN